MKNSRISAQFALALLLALAASGLASAMSPCQTDCEASYKYCMSSGKDSQRACLIKHEKCRKSCEKKDGAGSPGSAG